MGGEAGGDGDRATSTQVSHLFRRGTLPHLLHTSSSSQEEGPRLRSPPPLTAPCEPGEGCGEFLPPLAFFLCCLQGERGRRTTRCWGTDLWLGGPLGRESRGVAGAGGLHAGAMDRAALLGLSRLCALWAALLALFPCGAQGNWM